MNSRFWLAFIVLNFVFKTTNCQSFLAERDFLYPDKKQYDTTSALRREMVYEYLIQKGSVTDSALERATTFDSFGHKQRLWLYGRGNLKQRYGYIYKQNILQSFDEENLMQQFKINHAIDYGENGKPVTETTTAVDKNHVVQYQYHYNADNNISAIYWSINNSKPQLLKQYTYDNKRLSKIEEWTAGAKAAFTIIFEYDTVGNSASEYYMQGKKRLLANSFFFDSVGKIIRKIAYLGNAVDGQFGNINPDLSDQHFVYNEQGMTKEIRFLKNGQLTYLIKYFNYYE